MSGSNMNNHGSLHTIGYQARSQDDLLEKILSEAVDVVIDVREVPWSRKKGMSKSGLKELFSGHGIDYVHAKFAGNPKEIRRNATSHRECLESYGRYLSGRPEVVDEFDLLVRPLIIEGKKVCLLCYERHPDDCHRTILLNKWLDSFGISVDVTHIDPGGALRFLMKETDPPGEDLA